VLLHPTTRALLSAGLVALALLSDASAQPNLGFATRRYDRGVALYDRGAYDRALEEFRASMALYSSPNTRLYIGRTLRELGRLAEAAAELEAAAREAAERTATEPRYTATRDAATAERRALEPRLARLVLKLRRVPDGARVRVAGAEVPPAARGLPIVVTPGRVEVVVETPGRAALRRQVAVRAGATLELELELELPGRPATDPAKKAGPPVERETSEAPSGRTRLAGWLTIGAAAATLGASAVFGWRAAATHDELESCDRDLDCSLSSRREPLATEGRTFAALTYVSAGVGLAAAAVGTWLVLTAPRGRGEERRKVALTPGIGGLVVQGRF
jgi:hypothetical protein